MPLAAYRRLIARSLEESSLSRIQHWLHGPASFGMISAFRSGTDPEVNRANQARLGASLRQAGYGFIETTGGYKEMGKEAGEEWSFFVPGVQAGEKSRNVVETDNRLKGVLLEQGAKYEQDTVLYRPFEEKMIKLINCATRTEKAIGNDVSFKKVEEFWTRLRNGTHAATGSAFAVAYRNPNPKATPQHTPAKTRVTDPAIP